jgi:hypothetical protein
MIKLYPLKFCYSGDFYMERELDIRGFNPILPFAQASTHHFPSSAKNDHAEIQVKTPCIRIFNALTVSCEAPYQESQSQSELRLKIDSLTQEIVDRFLRASIDVQIIVEANEAFYQCIEAKLNKADYSLTRRSHLEVSSPKQKFTGILVNTSKFMLMGVDTICQEYQDEEGEGVQLSIPYVHLRDQATQEQTIVAGVHIPEVFSQRPTRGLRSLAQILTKLWENSKGYFDLVAMGNFNTPPMYLEEDLLQKMPRTSSHLYPGYLGHVNSRREAVNYDQLVMIPGRKDKKCSYRLAPAEDLSRSSQALISSVEKERKRS